MNRIFTRKLSLFLLAMCAVVALQAQNTSLPYFNGFENPNDTAGWTFKKRRGASGFEVGNATHCLGFKSMYISPDSGHTATYVGTANYVSIAYKSFTLPAGTYNLAFDYQCGGDGTNQDMKVAWAPASTSLAAASLGSYPNAITLNQFTDGTGANTFGISAWKHVTGTVTVPAGGGTYNLCFAFRTNSSMVSAPGACVDNIQLDTVKTSSDCTQVPYNIQVVKDPQHGVIITWNGNASEYEVIGASASDPMDYSYCEHTGITTTSDTMQYSELGEGQYFFYVRAICGSDTSIYGVITNVLIYDVSAHCIDFITFNAPTTQCTYGTYSNPYQTNGYIDNGPSQMSSRHTTHTDLNETDPRTNGALHTVPTGDVMSVRLGNWDTGAEGEAITYTYNVPAGSALILMMKYAIVFEEPGHDDPPEFLLEIMNMNNVLLDVICTKANFLCDGTLTKGWHTCSYGYSDIWWKEWTTIGVNLTQYAGQTVKIRLTTKDCDWSGHFGYAYFTLGCSNAEFTGMSCGSGEATEIKAPDGFNYQWTNNCTGQVVSTDQGLPISGTDTCSYTCRCSYKENSSCSFTLTAYTIPRLPESNFSYTVTYDSCNTYITFVNNSQVYLLQGGVKTYLPTEKITSQVWSVNTRHKNRSYYNRTSGSKNFQKLVIPKEGDTIDITLTSWANGCDDDTIVTIYCPALQESYGVTSRYVCQGSPVTFNGEQYTFITRDTIEIVAKDGSKRYITGQKQIQVIDTLKSWCGCDSILELNLAAMITDTTQVDTLICSNQQYCLRVKDINGNYVIDTCVNSHGHHDFYVPSSLKTCDSLYYSVDLTVLDILDVGLSLQSAEICADDQSFTAAYDLKFGKLNGFKAVYDHVIPPTPDTVQFDRDSLLTFVLPDNDWDPATGSGTYVLPDNYVATVTLYNYYKECGDVVVTMPFTIQYPKDVVVQRWNDFLAVRDSAYNGGYKFEDYRWYIDGQEVEGHVAASQFYREGEPLDTSKRYQIALRRVNDTAYIKTCRFTPVLYDQSEIDDIRATISEGGAQTASNAPMKAKAYLYNSAGVLVGTYEFEEGVTYFDTPAEPGIYIMLYIFEDGTRSSVKFVVK